jgi:hypothetical protein
MQVINRCPGRHRMGQSQNREVVVNRTIGARFETLVLRIDVDVSHRDAEAEVAAYVEIEAEAARK